MSQPEQKKRRLPILSCIALICGLTSAWATMYVNLELWKSNQQPRSSWEGMGLVVAVLFIHGAGFWLAVAGAISSVIAMARHERWRVLQIVAGLSTFGIFGYYAYRYGHNLKYFLPQGLRDT